MGLWTKVLLMGFILMMAVVAGLVAAMLKKARGDSFLEVIPHSFGVFGATGGFLLLLVEAFNRL